MEEGEMAVNILFFKSSSIKSVKTTTYRACVILFF